MKLDIKMSGDYGEINGEVIVIIKCIQTNEILVEATYETFTMANEMIAIFIEEFDDEAYLADCLLDFEEFCEANEQFITEILAESGADREMDFDLEKEQERIYDMALKSQSHLVFKPCQPKEVK